MKDNKTAKKKAIVEEDYDPIDPINPYWNFIRLMEERAMKRGEDMDKYRGELKRIFGEDYPF